MVPCHEASTAIHPGALGASLSYVRTMLPIHVYSRANCRVFLWWVRGMADLQMQKFSISIAQSSFFGLEPLRLIIFKACLRFLDATVRDDSDGHASLGPFSSSKNMERGRGLMQGARGSFGRFDSSRLKPAISASPMGQMIWGSGGIWAERPTQAGSKTTEMAPRRSQDTLEGKHCQR